MNSINILDYTGLIHAVLKGIPWTYTNNSLEYNDMVQECYIGLIRAVKSYNSDKGSFSTYATYWIKQAALKAYCNQSSMIRKPINLYWDYIKTKKENNDTSNSFIDPKLQDIENSINVISLDASIKDKDDLTLSDTIPYKSDFYEKTLYKFDLITLNQDLDRYMNELLNSQQKEIVKKWIGWNGRIQHSKIELARQYNKTASQITNIINKATRTIYKKYSRNLMKNYPDFINFQVINSNIDEYKFIKKIFYGYLEDYIKPGSLIILNGIRYKVVGANKFYIIYHDGEAINYIDTNKIDEISELEYGFKEIHLKSRSN